LNYLKSAGFRVLTNEQVTISGLRIAGVTDPAWGEKREDARVLGTAVPGDTTIFLKHRPWIEDAAIGRFTLQLSGHAHCGQLFPFNFLTGLAYPMQDGLYRLGQDSWLYTSRGTGSWGPPMRLFSPPEITLIELTADGKP
jgi:predicted MPP superfamily phosphohydrolase